MKVSVLIMTYNHASFIRQAIDSVLAQEVDFEFEILISEDCSTDGTREIIQEYHRRHPDLIRLLLSERNVRTNAVVSRGIEAATGRYVALLDGDDYWTATNKLQRQAAFLDDHSECAICFHNATVVDEEGHREPRNWTPAHHPEITTLDEIWLGNFIATCSTMFRRGLVDPIPAWYYDFFPITDWPLHILNAEHGHIGYIDEVMGVYRHHGGGLYSSKKETDKLGATLDFYRKIDACLDFRYHETVETAISKYFLEWSEEYLRRGDRRSARSCYRIFLKGRPVNGYVSFERMVGTGLRLFLPARTLPRRLRKLGGRPPIRPEPEVDSNAKTSVAAD